MWAPFVSPQTNFKMHSHFPLVAPLWLPNVNACLCPVQPACSKGKSQITSSRKPFHWPSSIQLSTFFAESIHFLYGKHQQRLAGEKVRTCFGDTCKTIKHPRRLRAECKRERWSAGGGRGAIFWKSSYSQKNKRGTIQERRRCAVMLSGLKM